jgi:hypothetical protein
MARFANPSRCAITPPSFDTWAFVFQMTAFMEGPEWKNTMGDLYFVVTETLRNMTVQMERLLS